MKRERRERGEREVREKGRRREMEGERQRETESSLPIKKFATKKTILSQLVVFIHSKVFHVFVFMTEVCRAMGQKGNTPLANESKQGGYKTPSQYAPDKISSHGVHKGQTPKLLSLLCTRGRIF